MYVLEIGTYRADIEFESGALTLRANKDGCKLCVYPSALGEASGNYLHIEKEPMKPSKFIRANTLWNNNFRNTRLTANSDLIDSVDIFINEAKADIVLAHSVNETHHDHRAVAASNIEVIHFATNIVSHEIPRTKDIKPPQSFCDVLDDIDENEFFNKAFKTTKRQGLSQINCSKRMCSILCLSELDHRSKNLFILTP
jgi:hypothetical protein